MREGRTALHGGVVGEVGDGVIALDGNPALVVHGLVGLPSDTQRPAETGEHDEDTHAIQQTIHSVAPRVP